MGFEDKVIVVDLDGTVCTIEEDYSRCQPMPGSIDALRTIRQKGYKVYIYTGRHINHFELNKSSKLVPMAQIPIKKEAVVIEG